MRERVQRWVAAYGPTRVSGDLAVMSGLLGVFTALVSILVPDVANVGGCVALGMWVSAQYANVAGE